MAADYDQAISECAALVDKCDRILMREGEVPPVATLTEWIRSVAQILKAIAIDLRDRASYEAEMKERS